MGGATRDYLATLPISPWQQHWLDLRLLLVADMLLWAPFLVTLVLSPSSEMVVRWIFFFFLMLALQITVLQRKDMALLGIVMLDLLFVVSTNLQILCVLGILLSLGLLCPLPVGFKSSKWMSFEKGINVRISSPRLPILTIQSKILFSENRVATISRCLIIIMMYALASLALFVNISLPILPLVFTGQTLLFSAFFPLLAESHERYRGYMLSLPIARKFWQRSDFLLIVNVSSISNLLFGLLFLLYGKITGLALLFNLLLQLPLMFMLLPIRNKLKQQGATVAFSLAIVWGVILYYLS